MAVEAQSVEWRNQCLLDMKYHQKGLLEDAASFLKAVWEASAIEEGITRLLVPPQYHEASEAIQVAYKWTTMRLHPDKFPGGGDCWEREIGWLIVSAWHNKTLFFA